MKDVINLKIRNIVEQGQYVSRRFSEGTLELQARMFSTDYHYNTTTADNRFHFTSKTQTFVLDAKDFDWRIFWDKLGNVTVNDDEEIDEPFEHFDAGTSVVEVWQWFEWFFDITLGNEIFCR